MEDPTTNPQNDIPSSNTFLFLSYLFLASFLVSFSFLTNHKKGSFFLSLLLFGPIFYFSYFETKQENLEPTTTNDPSSSSSSSFLSLFSETALSLLSLFLPKFEKEFLFSFWGIAILCFWIQIFLFFLSKMSRKFSFILYKEKLYCSGIYGMLWSTDFRWKTPPDPSSFSSHEGERKKKRIVFIRHGESNWNEIFNRGFGPLFFFRLLKGWMTEFWLLPTRDSLFVDAALSEEGLDQVDDLRHFLKHPPSSVCENFSDLLSLLRGDDENVGDESVVVASNLRRAIGTAAVGLRDRLQKTGEKILILSSLQEISRNIDANAIARAQEIPFLESIASHLNVGESEKSSPPPPPPPPPSSSSSSSSSSVDHLFCPQLNYGQKPIGGKKSNGLRRMKEFAKWACQQQKQTIIVGGGHSFYFRAFFRCFLDAPANHTAKQYIMNNTAIVSFELEEVKVEGKLRYRIPEESLKEVYSGKLNAFDERAFKVPRKK